MRSAAFSLPLVALACAGSAQAATVTLDVDGAYREIAPRTYFVPGGSEVGLRGSLLDDAGVAGATCLEALRQPLGVATWTSDGVWCPAGAWTGGVRVTENVRLKAAVVPDARNGAAESDVLTLLTAPRLTWTRSHGALRFDVARGADDYRGTLTVRERGRVVARTRVAGGAARSLRLGSTRRFTATLKPSDPARWTAVAATGRAGRSGSARPLSPAAA